MSNLVPASRLVQASMSKTDLLLKCQYWASPFARPFKAPKGKEKQHLRFGSAFHKCCEIYLRSGGKKLPVFELVAKKYDVPEIRLRSFFQRWKEFIDDLHTARFTDNRIRFVEEKLAYNPFTDTVRFLPSKKERDYTERRLGEFPGTCDYIFAPANEDFFVVFDWKTGSSDYDAKMNGQLRSTALAMSRHLKRFTAIVFIVRLDEDFLEPYEATLKLEDLEHHRRVLRAALSAAERDPAMRVGAHCSGLYCPIIETCSAHAGPSALVDEVYDALDRSRLAFQYERFLAARKMFDACEDRFKLEIEMNGPFQLRDGSWVTLEPQSRETLSKSSIIRALGAVDGQELIAELEAAGCVDRTDYKKITYKKEPAGK